MALEKQDLLEWNSHPVTIAIFKQVKSQVDALNSESVLCTTSTGYDLASTAMKAAYNDGKAAGAEAMLEAYEELSGGEE